MDRDISWLIRDFSRFGGPIMAASSARVLLDVWREVCRHIAIDESVTRVTPILVERLPVEELLVRQVDVARGLLDTVAVGLVRPGANSLGAKTDCTPRELARIVEWC